MTTLSRFAKRRVVDRELAIVLETSGHATFHVIPEQQLKSLPNSGKLNFNPNSKVEIREPVLLTADNPIDIYSARCDFTVSSFPEIFDKPLESSTDDQEFSSITGVAGSLIQNREGIVKQLALLYVRIKLSLSALKEVAKLIKVLGNDIPIDPRTILQTTSTPIQSKTFQHFSLRKGILSKLKKGMLDKDIRVIKLQINIDGTFVFKTNSVHLWPILCRVTNSFDVQPFVVSIFAGKGKPPGLEEYLRPFLDELIRFQEGDLQCEGNIYKVEISSFVSDAPARQFLKVITGHGGFDGCERCNQEGVHDKFYHCMTFPELVDILLANRSFRNKLHKNHHKGSSPWLRLNINRISCFPLDYMHLVLLGVFKRLLTIWTGDWSKKHIQHKLEIWERAQLERKLHRIRLSPRRISPHSNNFETLYPTECQRIAHASFVYWASNLLMHSFK